MVCHFDVQTCQYRLRSLHTCHLSRIWERICQARDLLLVWVLFVEKFSLLVHIDESPLPSPLRSFIYYPSTFVYVLQEEIICSQIRSSNQNISLRRQQNASCSDPQHHPSLSYKWPSYSKCLPYSTIGNVL